jgi:hypothetical protein
LAYLADTLRDTLYNNWALAAPLRKSGTAGEKGQPVYFYAHTQIPAKEARKAVIVRKTSPLENVITHPKFEEVSDTFEITCYYVNQGGSLETYDVSETNIENMADEVLRILKTVYNPINGTGTFYRSNQVWQNRDDLTQLTQVLQRVLTFTLTKVRSGLTTVFKGYGGVLAFDTSESTGDSLPVSDYTYTEAYDVNWTGGYGQIEEPIDQNPNGEHIPAFFTSRYDGRFNCTMSMKKADVGTDTHQLPTIGGIRSIGEVSEVVFLWSMTNTEPTPATLTASIKVRILSIEPNISLEDIAKVRLVGKIITPPTLIIS